MPDFPALFSLSLLMQVTDSAFAAQEFRDSLCNGLVDDFMQARKSNSPSAVAQRASAQGTHTQAHGNRYDPEESDQGEALSRLVEIAFQACSFSFRRDLFSSMKLLMSLAAPSRRFHCS